MTMVANIAKPSTAMASPTIVVAPSSVTSSQMKKLSTIAAPAVDAVNAA